MSVFGNARYGGEFTKRKYFKLKDGESVFRILPPMGDLAAEGRWSVFHRVHYGYQDSKGKNRPFVSSLVKNNKTKMVEVPDAAVERIETLKAQLEAAKKANNVALAEQLNKLLKQYNLDSNHYMNVIDAQGNIGILKIRHKAMLALQQKIKALRDNGVDPLSPEDGRFFVFRRSGTALETTFSVDVLTEKIKVEGIGVVNKEVVHSLDAEIANRCVVQNKDGSFTYKEAANLNTLFKKPTSEEVARIVKEGARAVDEILAPKSNSQSAAAAEEVIEDEPDYEEETSSAPTQAAPKQETPAAAQTAAPPQAAPAQTTAAPKAESLSAPTKTTADVVSTMSDEELLKSLGI